MKHTILEEIKLDFQYADPKRAAALGADAAAARGVLESRKGPGSDYLGWLDLPGNIQSDLTAIQQAAEEARKSEALVCVGIGGSYLGARAVIEALRGPLRGGFPVYFAGHQLDARYHQDLLKLLEGKRYAVNVISKSGTTTEPGVAFRLLWRDLSARYDGATLRKLVFATTDAKKGSLRKLADQAGLQTFVIPDDVGGRFSVLTPVGLLPIAAAGLDIAALVGGAAEMARALRDESNAGYDANPALQYACYRNSEYRRGRKIEIMASYQSGLSMFHEWWKQLFGESEGKQGRGIFPASVSLSTDLHSMGQWMQDGERSIFETVLDIIDEPGPTLFSQDNDDDGLNYLAGRSLHQVNRTALEATLQAHHSGDVACLTLRIARLDERILGALLYLFEYSCGISAYMLGVNPFDQPGVEAYKKNMFRLLGKPGA
ncbi:MAG: glucose-6-phosphate isomerase [Leptospirales bacterium]|nr:glucose-6-phosphate isomerase [Leptospirales bacterium]